MENKNLLRNHLRDFKKMAAKKKSARKPAKKAAAKRKPAKKAKKGGKR